MLLSDVLIETSGGASPIRCHGHRKGDAVQMKSLIERYQTDYYRARRPAPAARGLSARRRPADNVIAKMDDLTFSARRAGARRAGPDRRARGPGCTVSHAGAVAAARRHPPLPELAARTRRSTSRR